MSRRSVLFAVGLAVGVAATVALALVARRPWGEDSAAWRAVDAQVARAFPDVATVTTDHLAAWLADSSADPSGAAPLLLDARSPEEFAVSHVPGAVRVDPGASVGDLREAVLAQRAADPRGERPVVVYCSVGWRSAAVARRLAESGVGDVRNVRGSLFRWAAEGRPLVSAHGPAATVHPYDAVWGRLLPPQLRAEAE